MPQSYSAAAERSIGGIHEELVFSIVPATAAPSLIGQKLNGAVLTVVGDYYAECDIGGATEVECHLRATIAAGTLTSDVYTTYVDGVTKKTAFTGIGALASTVRQSVTLSGPKGCQKAVVKLTLATGPSTITQAEVNAL